MERHLRSLRKTLRRSLRLCGKLRLFYNPGWLSRTQAAEVSPDGTLSLYLRPTPKPCAPPCLEGLPTVELQHLNYLPAVVCGEHHCYMFVDSGTTTAFMSHSLAKEFGFLDHIVEYDTFQLMDWFGVQTREFGILRDVPVRLAGEVEAAMTFLVSPADYDLNDDLFLDNHFLRRRRVLQAFGDGRSRLHFQREDEARSSCSKVFQGVQYVLEAHLDRRLRDPPLIVHVDSGATHFYVSPKRMRAIRESAGCEEVKRVRVLLSDGRVLLDEELRTSADDSFDFILGNVALDRHRCILDYSAWRLYVQSGGEMFQAKLQRHFGH